MPTLKERFTDFLLGDEKRKLEEAFGLMTRAYAQGPWELPPDELMRQLKEQDPYLLQFYIDQLGWEIIGGYGLDTEAERQRAVADSERLYKRNALAQWIIWLWTNWGLGDRVTVTPNDEGAAEVWTEFWEADRNAAVLGDDKVKELSRWLLVKGNRYLAFYSSDILDGEATVRTIKPEEMTPVTNPQDDSEAWFYKREFTPSGQSGQLTWYYPDWATFFSDDLEVRWKKVVEANADVGGDAIRADRANGEEQLGGNSTDTVVCVLHVAHNIKDEDNLLGWPVLTVADLWIQVHGEFVEARTAVAQAVAAYVRRYQHKGGSRAQHGIRDAIRSRLSQTQAVDTNPPATAGSSEILNAAVEVTDLGLKTGATDAKADNEMFMHMALLGGGLFPTSAGLDTARWATALEMDKAQSMLFQQYQGFWGTQFRKMVKVVLLFQDKYGGQTFEDKTAQVNVDTFNLADFPAVAKTIGGLVRDALTPGVADGSIPVKAAREIGRKLWQICLQALGVDNAEELTDEELWEPDEEDDKTPEQLLPFTKPTGEQPEEEPEVVERIAAMIKENLGRGDVGAQQAAEWALAQILEGRV